MLLEPVMNRCSLRSALSVLAMLCSTGLAGAASCGNGPGGFEAWKRQFAEEARGQVGERAMSALDGTRYSARTINSDHG